VPVSTKITSGKKENNQGECSAVRRLPIRKNKKTEVKMFREDTKGKRGEWVGVLGGSQFRWLRKGRLVTVKINGRKWQVGKILIVTGKTRVVWLGQLGETNRKIPGGKEKKAQKWNHIRRQSTPRGGGTPGGQ